MKTDSALRLLVSLSDLTLVLNLRFLSLWLLYLPPPPILQLIPSANSKNNLVLGESVPENHSALWRTHFLPLHLDLVQENSERPWKSASAEFSMWAVQESCFFPVLQVPREDLKIIL